MMKSIFMFIYISFILLFSFSCIEKSVCYECILTPKSNIQTLLDSFVLINKYDNYVYELYIDKLDPNNYNLLIYTGERSLTEKENQLYNQDAIMVVFSSGVKFRVFSGIEHYFNNCHSKQITQKEVGNNQILWAIKDSCGILDIYEIDGGYPFFPFPRKNASHLFTPPILK